MESYDYLFKILLVGDAAVGKSSLLQRFFDNTFTESYMSTIGVDFKIKGVNIDGKAVKMQIWDTAGQERFKTITSTYYKGSQGIILVFDLTDQNSFKNLEYWINEMKNNVESEICKVLVGNKFDLDSKREIEYDLAHAFAQEHNMKYYEVSAKSGTGVEQIFMELGKEVKDSVIINETPISKIRDVTLKEGENLNKK